MLRDLIFRVTVLTLLPLGAGAVPLELDPFPARIQRIAGTSSGAFVLERSATDPLWYLDLRTAPRRIPVPVTQVVSDIAWDEDVAMLWGCTQDEVFVTNASGGWSSWAVEPPDDNDRYYGCRILPSPGGTAWMLRDYAREGRTETAMFAVALRERAAAPPLVVEGLHLGASTSNEIGGFWSHVTWKATDGRFAQGLAHFDGRDWIVWSEQREAWVGGPFDDVHPLSVPIVPSWIAADGAGGVVMLAHPNLLLRLRAPSGYANLESAQLQCPKYGCGSVAAFRDDVAWFARGTAEGPRLLQFAPSGSVVAEERIPLPDWYDSGHAPVDVDLVGSDVWVAFPNKVARRGSNGWTVAVSRTEAQTWRDAADADGARQAAGVAVGALALGLVAAAPLALVTDRSPYGRLLIETSAGTAAAALPVALMLGNAPYRGWERRTAPLVFFHGVLMGVGLPVVPLVFVESFHDREGDPFPLGWAFAGAAAGIVGALLVDGVFELLGFEARIARVMLGASIVASSATTAFHVAAGR